MSRSRFHSTTSVLALALAAASSACSGGDTCGPGTAAIDALALAGTGVDVHYTALGASANGDCPDPGAPSGVVSLTIDGTQTGSSFSITLCVPRPDEIGRTTAQLGTDVRIMNLDATLGAGCTLARAASKAPTGTVIGSGVCSNGTDPAGFALTFDGVVPMTRTCGASVDELDLALTGTVAISGPK